VACILKAPSESGKGVIVFTTPERDQAIREDRGMANAITRLKGRWIVGLHHHWHDHAFVYDPLFDFSLAGEGDLVTADGSDVPLITLDACNFVPAEFAPGGMKFWDVLYVARAVTFKGLPQFLECVRSLYDAGDRLRVLCVCPIPPERPGDATFVDLEQEYVERFTAEERRYFTLWALRHDYPFPLDLPTLAHLYRSSRVFVHFAPDERRCRVAGYAWSVGLPVVARGSVGSLLPARLRCPPFFYEAHAYEAFPRQIMSALSTSERDDPRRVEDVRRFFSSESSTFELRRQLAQRFPDAGLDEDEGWFVNDLNLRLGRHHGISVGANNVESSIGQLVQALSAAPGTMSVLRGSTDPETTLAGLGARRAPETGRARRSRWLEGMRGRR
jgi:hypothetical protein